LQGFWGLHGMQGAAVRARLAPLNFGSDNIRLAARKEHKKYLEEFLGKSSI